MDKRYAKVTAETLKKLSKCFSDEEEFRGFGLRLRSLAFTCEMYHRAGEFCDEASKNGVILKQVCLFTLFCAENMELVHELVRNLEVEFLTKEEFNLLED